MSGASPSRPIAAQGLVVHQPLALGPVTQVWLGHFRGRACVVKFPADRYARHRGVARLIEREWSFLVDAAQSGVVATWGLVIADTGPGVVTAFLPGGDLVPLAGSHPRHWAAPVRGVARALEGLHARGIVHRDVKPRNVLLGADAGGTLIDFALAMRTGQVSRAGGGTAAYRRAEPAPGERAAEHEDVYAFAVTVYELLSGSLPYGRCPDAARRREPPRCPLARSPSLAGEPAVAALAELTLATLRAGADEHAPGLGDFRAALRAIIAG